MGIAILMTIFVFPETMSHARMGKLAEQLVRVQKLVEIHDAVLTARPIPRLSGSSRR